jgi:hypothetical protein
MFDSCVYFTTYSGQLMPPFYIGSKYLKDMNGYHGSVTSQKWIDIWKKELKENPHLFYTEIVSLHETRQDAYDEEERYQRQEDVVKSDLYLNECFANGNFSTDGQTWVLSEETKQKMRKPKLNTDNMYGSKNWWTEETKAIQSDKMKGDKNPIFRFGNPFKDKHHTEETKEELSKLCSRLVICPHCKKQGGITAMHRHHFDNCPKHPLFPLIYNKEDICQYCYKICVTKKNRALHFEKCRKNPNRKSPIVQNLVCQHCGKEDQAIGNIGRMKRNHFDKCKYKSLDLIQ